MYAIADLRIFLYAGRNEYAQYRDLQNIIRRNSADHLVGIIDAILGEERYTTDTEIHLEVWRASGISDHDRVRELLLSFSGQRDSNVPRLWSMLPDGTFSRIPGEPALH